MEFFNRAAGLLHRSLTAPGNCLEATPAIFWRTALYAVFWIYIALFPIGYGWREAMPPLAFIFLVLYYKYAWQQSALAKFGPKWLFYCAGLMIVCGVVFSTNPWASFLHAGTGLNKAYILPFIAMECARDERDLAGLVWACAFACFWEGLDGLWQAFSGHDFIMGYAPNNGRLTGSLGDYTVGNYLALALVPAAGVWFILRRYFAIFPCILLFFSLFWPAAFLFMGASSRSGLLAIAGAIALWAAISSRRFSWKIIVLPLSVFAAFILCQPERLAPGAVMRDNRWDLWHLGWRVFEEHPWLGAGAGQYNEAFRSLGLSPRHEAITISHPHNLYLDMLYAHGLVGFSLGCLFIFGFLLWGLRQIRPGLAEETSSRGSSIFWRLAACFWLGYAAWLINGIFGHDFYRTWWLAQAMIALGIMAGASVSGNAGKD